MRMCIHGQVGTALSPLLFAAFLLIGSAPYRIIEAQVDKKAQAQADLDKAVALCKQGELAEARALLVKIKESGVRLRTYELGDADPVDWHIHLIDRKLREEKTGKRIEQQVDKIEQKAKALEIFDNAKRLYREGLWAEARVLFLQVRDSGVDIGFFRSREINGYLRRIDAQVDRLLRSPGSPTAKR